MKLITLVENTSLTPEFGHKHGLSFYIETGKHKLLFDLGSDELFLQNAAKLKVDIEAVDTVIISHGHYDHGGALKLFLQRNRNAKIYIREKAFDSFFSKIFGIASSVGLDQMLKDHERFIFTEDDCIIDDELRLFSNITTKECYSTSNNTLYVKTETGFQPDDFRHEQSLIINEDGRYTLVAGCAHSGIINIQKKAEGLIGCELNTVISGMHLINPMSFRRSNSALARKIADRLQVKSTRYYTCHCTGLKAYQLMKSMLGEQISYLSAGSSIEI